LEPFQIIHEAAAVLFAILLAHFLSADGERGYDIIAHASLYATTDPLGAKPDHFLLLHQVVGMLRQMGKSVDFLAYEGGCRGCHTFPPRVFGCVEGDGHNVYAWPDPGITPTYFLTSM